MGNMAQRGKKGGTKTPDSSKVAGPAPGKVVEKKPKGGGRVSTTSKRSPVAIGATPTLKPPGHAGMAQVNLEAPTVSTPTVPAPDTNGYVNSDASAQPNLELKIDLKPAAIPSRPPERPNLPKGIARFLMPPDSNPKVEEPKANEKSLEISKPSTLATPPKPRALAPASADASGPVMEAPPVFSTLGTMPALTRPPVQIPRHAPVRQPEPQVPAAPTGLPPEATHSTLQPPLLFEVAWEVCWQLGGIYTVLRTKAATTLRTWGDRYCLIGPYNPQTAPVEFEPEEPQGAIAQALQQLRENGVPCYFGRWMIAGRPQVILLDYRAGFRELDSNKYKMWADHGISINSNDGEMNEVVAFGFAVTEFFRLLSGLVTDRSILAHFHEWMGGVAVPRIAHLRLPVATVFTTHATLLGRYIAGDNSEFYNHLPFINPDFEAQKYQIYSRYQIEKAAAHASTVFTTVSEVTSFEAEKLLGRRPEVILPNGLNIQRFAALHEFQNLHRQYKEKIHEFVMGHFFPCYNFDLERTIYFVTSGRYEYRNKGMDLFIEAMWRLNQRLRYVPDRPTVVVFVITKAPVKHVNIAALQNQTMFGELRRTCTSLQEEMGQQLFTAAAQGRVADPKELLTGDAIVRLKRAMHAWRTGQAPAIVTHDLIDDATDPVLKHLRHRHLFNGADDPVKMVFHPQFVTSTGPLIHLDYEQLIRGCHMGIFPSYYEPWGYTPMECVAMGIPAVTTDLSGFGAYVRRHIPDSNDKGICVLNRRYRGFDEACNELVDYLFDFVRMNRRQRIELRNRVERLSELFDWSALIRHYNEAHDLALERIGSTRPGRLEIRLV